jgi:hypothetical protein
VGAATVSHWSAGILARMSDKREARTNAVRVALALRARMPALPLSRMTTSGISTMMRIPLISILIDWVVADRECLK